MNKIMDQKNINYFEILKKSLKITWHNKYLWWFGLFMALGSGGANFNFSFNKDEWSSIMGAGQGSQEVFGDFINQHSGWIILSVVIMAIIVIIFLILRIVGQAGLIKLVGSIEKGKKAGFHIGFCEGKKLFWKFFITGILIGLFVFGTIIVLSLPVIYLFYLEAYPIAFLSLFFAIAIFVPLAVLASFINTYGLIYIALGNLKIGAALENSYKLFRKNIFQSIIMAVILVAISAAIGIAMFMFFTILILLLLPLGIILYSILNKIGIIIAVILGLFLFVPIILFVRSVYEVYRQTAWVLFFKRIAVAKEDIGQETEKEIVKKKIPEPESA